MILKKARARLFQNIVDSNSVDIEGNVTCLVGKNESGKTAFLQALRKLNPTIPQDFVPRDDYPRWRWKRDQRKEDLSSKIPIESIWKLTVQEIEQAEKVLGEDVFNSDEITIKKNYANNLTIQADIDLYKIFKNAIHKIDPESELRKAVSKKNTEESISTGWAKAASETPPNTEEELFANTLITEGIESKLNEIFLKKIPKIFYFGKYSELPPEVIIEDLINNPAGKDESMETSRALINLSGSSPRELIEEDYETRVAELEASAVEVTNSVLEYWTQNQFIRVSFDSDKSIDKSNSKNVKVVNHILKIRLHDDLHQFTTSFDKRSAGFRWFFSFLVAFSEYEFEEQPVIILLDEPGLNLHAKAQNDLLKYINEKLSPNHQIIYTTHSPFMVDSEKLKSVRLVEDKTKRDDKIGSKVTNDVLSTDRDTIFPLQSALGYDLGQNLFVGPNNLIVEGTSDYIYLSKLSRHLEKKGKSHLDLGKISLTPVGGASKIPTFIALLGQQLQVTVLVDSSPQANQNIRELINKGYLDGNKFITIGEIINQNTADIEDLFSVSEYLDLYNEAFDTSLSESDLHGSDQIVKRIEREENSYDHGKPAEILLRDQGNFLSNLSPQTINNFDQLFERINDTF